MQNRKILNRFFINYGITRMRLILILDTLQSNSTFYQSLYSFFSSQPADLWYLERWIVFVSFFHVNHVPFVLRHVFNLPDICNCDAMMMQINCIVSHADFRTVPRLGHQLWNSVTKLGIHWYQTATSLYYIIQVALVPGPVRWCSHVWLAGKCLKISFTSLRLFDMLQVDSLVRKLVQQLLNGSLLSTNLILDTAQFNSLLCMIWTTPDTILLLSMQRGKTLSNIHAAAEISSS